MEQSFGEYIKDLRKQRDLTMRELAKLIDKSPSMISEIESGTRYPSDDMMADLARALRTTVDDFKRFDPRPQKREINAVIKERPEYVWALTRVAEAAKEGISQEELRRIIDQINTVKNSGGSNIGE